MEVHPAYLLDCTICCQGLVRLDRVIHIIQFIITITIRITRWVSISSRILITTTSSNNNNNIITDCSYRRPICRIGIPSAPIRTTLTIR